MGRTSTGNYELSYGERATLKQKFDLTDQQLDESLAKLRESLIKSETMPEAIFDFGTSVAFADEVISYQEKRIEELGEKIKEHNPAIWESVGRFFVNIGRKIEYGLDYTKSHFFGQSDPLIINRVYDRILTENISFFNGSDYISEETTLREDPTTGYYEDPFGLKRWWQEDEIVIVRYQDKFAAFGEKFFDTLMNEQEDVDLDSPSIIDTLGNRFNDPDVDKKIEKFISVKDLINSFSQGVQAFNGGDGIYHIQIERQGVLFPSEEDIRHWCGYVNSYDEEGNEQRIPIRDKEFLLDLIMKSKGE